MKKDRRLSGGDRENYLICHRKGWKVGCNRRVVVRKKETKKRKRGWRLRGGVDKKGGLETEEGCRIGQCLIGWDKGHR